MEIPIIRENLIDSHNKKITDYYEFESETLGQGSFGFVKIGRIKNTSIKRAIKIVPKLKIVNKDLLHSEILIMKQVDHPNIIRLFESFEDSQYIYLVMELCKGGELFERIIQQGNIQESEAKSIFMQLICAISYLHSINIVHCDIKPQNFLFYDKSSDPKIKLIDFGLSKSMKNRNLLSTCSGTCSYIAPEVLQGPYDIKSDIWSLGVILFMLLSGYLPFEGPTQESILRSVLLNPLVFEETIWLEISEEAKDLISHMIERDISKRFTCQEILNHPWLNCLNQPTNIRLHVDRLKKYQNNQILKKSVLNYMATQCETGEIRSLTEIFLRLDTNKDGHLSANEIKLALASSNIDIQELDKILDALDANNDGKIDFNEFIAAAMGRGIYLCSEKLWNSFKRFDLNGNGRISAEEIRDVLDSGHFVKDPDLWVQMVKDADLDGDGSLTFEEFVVMMDKELVNK